MLGTLYGQRRVIIGGVLAYYNGDYGDSTIGKVIGHCSFVSTLTMLIGTMLANGFSYTFIDLYATITGTSL